MQSDFLKKRNMVVFLIIAAASLLRLYNIDGSMFDFNPLRQAVNGFITRHIAFDPHVNILIPQLDNMGPSPAYFMCELPVLQFITAQLIKVFGQHNWVFRSPQVIFFIISAVYFFKIADKLAGYRIAVISLIFYCLAPMSILMSRVFQIDALMILSLFVSIYYLIVWFENEKIENLILSLSGLLLFTLLKLPNFYILILLFSCFLIYSKQRLIYRYLAGLALVFLINYWWWFLFSAPIRNAYPNEYTFVQGTSIFSLKHTLYIMGQYIFSFQYWVTTFKQTFLQVLSPMIFVLFMFGLFVKKVHKLWLVLVTWVCAVFIYLTFVPGAGLQDYYKLHLVPPAVILAALAYEKIFSAIKARWKKNFTLFVFWFVSCASIFAIVYPIVRYKPIFQQQEALGKKVQELSRKDDLVIASFGPDALLLFYCDRRGWNQYLLSGQDNIALLEDRRRQGAAYFISGNLEEFEAHAAFKEHMMKKYKLVSTAPRQFLPPQKFSLDYFIWLLTGKRKELERASLGYVIFNLRKN